jgi:tryptophan synthase alpha chain
MTLRDIFTRAQEESRAVLIGYLPAGYPSVAEARELMDVMVEAGVDAIEVGLPYSDPLMDGPVIQEAVETALRAGTTTDDVLATVDHVAQSGASVVVMSYWNPIERFGVERFASRLAQAGGLGVVTPDLTIEEADEWHRASTAHELDRIFLVAPSSTDERIADITRQTSGFVYAASMMGVTGGSVGGAAGDLVARTRRQTDLPVAVGLGVSTGEQAADLARIADGVIVGSAFIRQIAAATSPADAKVRVRDFAAELAAGVRSAPKYPQSGEESHA